jgi:hypothetical protein
MAIHSSIVAIMLRQSGLAVPLRLVELTNQSAACVVPPTTVGARSSLLYTRMLRPSRTQKQGLQWRRWRRSAAGGCAKDLADLRRQLIKLERFLQQWS